MTGPWCEQPGRCGRRAAYRWRGLWTCGICHYKLTLNKKKE